MLQLDDIDLDNIIHPDGPGHAAYAAGHMNGSQQ